MAQPVEVLPYEPELSSIPGTHKKMEERANAEKFTVDLNTCTVAHVWVFISTQLINM